MAVIPSLPVTLQNGTTADATQVMANFNAIVSAVNANSANSGINTNITQLQGLTVAVAVNQGGTGQQILTPNAVLIGEGTNGINGAAPGAIGTVLTSNGPGVDPSFQAIQLPVGSLYFNATNSANPATMLGYGTWQAFGAARVIMGVGTGTDINSNSMTVAAGATGGEYIHTLSVNEMPSHNHTDAGHSHVINVATSSFVCSGSGANFALTSNGTRSQTDYASIQYTGGGAAHNNVQPYIGVYVWQRTA